MEMVNRYFNAGSFRYGFNGQEKSNEATGEGNHNTAEFWEYDTRLGRRWNLDPKPSVGISQYSAFSNNPIFNSDPLGDTSVVGAGGTQKVDIDEKANSLQFYNSSEYNTANGKLVPVQPGQLRSFSNALGTFKAKWNTTKNGVSFAGYLNDKNQSLEAAVKEANDFGSSWVGKYFGWALSQYKESQEDPLGHNLRLSLTLLSISATASVEPVGYSPGYNPSVTTQESMSALGTLSFTQRTMSLVTKYPANSSVVGTIENIFLMPGKIIDRYGSLGGRWFSTPGTSYGTRSIPSGFSPYTRFKVLKPFEVQKSLASPGMFSGQSGFGIQYQSPVGADILIKRKIIAPF